MKELFEVLHDIDCGKPCESEGLVDQVYRELHQLARAMMARENPGHTLQATALVHEVYIRLLKQFENDSSHTPKSDETRIESNAGGAIWNSRSHFFAAAAEAMRRILIDNARRKKRLKRGGNKNRVELRSDELVIDAPPDNLIALDEALQRLEMVDQVKADVVKLRYFAGLSVEETAASLEISTATVKRYWAYSKAWLSREIAKSD